MKRLPPFLIVVFALVPMVGVALYVMIDEFRDHDNIVRSAQKDSAQAAAFLVKERLDRAVDVAVSLATRPLVQQNTEKGSWDKALRSIKDVKDKYPYVDNIILYDAKGILRAIETGEQSLIGKDFSYRDYYQGVSKKWEPYVSEVFKKATEPKYNVVSIAVPIKKSILRM